MKIKLSNYWWKNFYVVSVIYAISMVFYVVEIMFGIDESMKSNEPTMYYVLMFVLPVLWSICCFDTAYLTPRKFLRIIDVDDFYFISSFFGKGKCIIDRQQQIYYAIFDCKESNFRGIKTYFVVSNRSFVYEERKPNWHSENRFIDYYDSKTQIIFPLNKKTESLIKCDEWIRVY